MNRIFLLLLIVCLIVFSSSCNLYHAVGGRWKTDRELRVVVPLKEDSGTTQLVVIDSASVNIPTSPISEADTSGTPASLDRYLPLWTRETNFTTFSGKAKVHYEGKGSDQNFTANIRIEKDYKIWISIVALGIYEAARALITPDTIIALDRVHKEVRILPFSEARNLLPVAVDFKTLQRLLIGDVLPGGPTPIAGFDSSGTLHLFAANAETRQELYLHSIDSTLVSQAFQGDSVSMNIRYADYSIENGRHFSKERNISVTDKGAEYHFDIGFNNMSFDEPVEMNFSIPDKYERK